MAVGFGIFTATRGGSPSTTSLPATPRLQATYAADRRPERSYGHGEPVIAGSPDSLYIVNPGDGSSNVSRYSNGDQLWTSYVPDGVPLAVYEFADGGPLVLTGNEESLLNRTITRLDLETGDVVWTMEFADGEEPEVIDGRLFVETWGEDLLQAGIELDPDTGTELNRLEDDFVGFEQHAVVTATAVEASAQRHTLDFQPTGPRVSFEKDEEYPAYAIIASTLDLNWVYYLEGHLMIASPDGETVAECAVDISLVVWLDVTDDGLILADALTELQVFKLEDGVCRSIFKRDGYNRAVVDDGYAVFNSFVGLTDRLSYEVVELATGETVATSEGQVLIAEGYAIKNLDGKATLVDLDNGTDVWTIDVPPDASIQLGDDLIAVVTPNGNDATVEIYADS